MNRDSVIRFLKSVSDSAKEEQLSLDHNCGVHDASGEFLGYLEVDNHSAILVLDGEVVADSSELDEK